MLRRAVGVAVIAFLLVFTVPPQFFPRDGSAIATEKLFGIVAFMFLVAVAAYLLVRRNTSVTIERRAAVGAALIPGVLFGVTASSPDAGTRIANFAFGASTLFVTVLLLGVTVHALAYGVSMVRSRFAPTA
jgi:Ca2+/Na+ antiporter